jgi:protein-S-isoprenylcysteine O-methyltransferase Ste14
MSRVLVTAIFLAVTGLTAMKAIGRIDEIFAADDGARAWAIAGYWVLKTAIIAAICYFVAVRNEPRTKSRNPVAVLAFVVALGAVAFLREPADSNSTTLVLIGDFVALAACVWLLASVLTLGRCFGILPEARGLVTRGPYSIVRHPVYLGEFGTFAGLLIAAPTAWNLAAVLAFCAGQAVRMRLEEEALTHEFPEYSDYAARTPAVVPGLRRAAPRRLAETRAAS